MKPNTRDNLITLVVFAIIIIWLWHAFAPASKAIVAAIDEQANFEKLSPTRKQMYMLEHYGHDSYHPVRITVEERRSR